MQTSVALSEKDLWQFCWYMETRGYVLALAQFLYSLLALAS